MPASGLGSVFGGKRLAINGFGRIGRAAFKVALTKKNLKVVAINDLTTPAMLAYLLKYDTVYGRYDKKVEAAKDGLKVDGVFYPVLQEKDPARLPWQKMKVNVVLECTGHFTSSEAAQSHLKAGAKRVIISAPAKDETTQTLVYGTNYSEQCLKWKKCDQVVSMASCTTNCIAPAIQVLQSAFGVEKAIMTTVHAYTSTQNLVDGPSQEISRTRASANNLIPTSTGAATATTKVIPELQNKFDGIAIRVPVICGSLADITAVLKKSVTVKEVNEAFRKAAKSPLFKGILDISDDHRVSSDYIGDLHSAIVDLEFTRVVGGNLVKVLAWYDNELAYSARLVEMAIGLK